MIGNIKEKLSSKYKKLEDSKALVKNYKEYFNWKKTTQLYNLIL